MRILVLSDTHGDTGAVEIAFARAGAELALHLGDCAGDMAYAMRSFPKFPCHTVCGNCDGETAAPTDLTLEIAGKRFYLLHGHTKNVKNGDSALLAAAKSRGADIVLYGHTHRPRFACVEGMRLLNPGSAKRRAAYDPRRASFAVLEIDETGVRAEILPLPCF